MQKICRQCSGIFEVTEDDLSFFKKISPVFQGKQELITPPTLCKDCRCRERLLWRPELHLFKRKSDRSGTSILSFLPEGAPCTVWSVEEWWQEDWDPLSYGREVDFSRPFFEQFQELFVEVPIPSLSIGGENQNSEYLNSASWLKNCYLLAGANYDEDCYYGNFVNHCKDCVDCNFADHCELCYECIDCSECYGLRYSQQCVNCSESAFLFSCKGSKNCFGSVNLVGKQYVFLNEQLTKEEYQRQLSETQLHSRQKVEDMQQFFYSHRLKYPHKFMLGEMNEHVTGNGIFRSRNVFDCFDVSDSEDCRNCIWFHKALHCRDCYAWGFSAQECYACLEVGMDSSRVCFSCLSYGDIDTLYSINCRSCTNVFGCVSLKHARYCIFNTQYSKEEYELLVPKIIAHMRDAKEWGEFFPMSFSPMAYNQSIAQDYFPLTKEEAMKLGARWGEEESIEKGFLGAEIPDSILDAEKNICEKTFRCATTGRPFKIIPQEFEFLRRNGIPLPSKSFFSRHAERLKKRNPRRVWNRECAKCQKPIVTSFAPERPEVVYCESCYLEAVY